MPLCVCEKIDSMFTMKLPPHQRHTVAITEEVKEGILLSLANRTRRIRTQMAMISFLVGHKFGMPCFPKKKTDALWPFPTPDESEEVMMRACSMLLNGTEW